MDVSRRIKRGAPLLAIVLTAMALAPASAGAAVNPELSGSVSNSETLSSVVAVAVAGNYAYVPGYYKGEVTAVNISNPAEPVIEGSSEASNDLLDATTINIAGGYAYVVSKNRNGAKGSESNDDGTGNSLTILDIHTNPASPKIVGSIRDANTLFGAYGVAMSGSYAYVASQGCLSGQPCPLETVGSSFAAIDIGNPASPSIAASIHNSSLPAPWEGTNALEHATSVAISGSYAYVTAAYSDRLTVVSIANPLDPTIVATLRDTTNLDFPVDVAVSGEYAYVADQVSPGRLTVVNVSNPADPQVVASLANSALDGAYRVRVRGDFAYVSAYSGSDVAVLDISNPLSPRLVASVSSAADLYKTTGLDLDSSGADLVASSPYLSSQTQPLYPPFPLQMGGPTMTGTLSDITLDPDPIEATIAAESEPANPTAQTSASFAFSVNDAVSAVECRLDSGSWTQCTSPTGQSYTALGEGVHTFEVRAIESTGKTRIANYSWAITAAPSNTAVPSIAGTAAQGQALTASTGSWNGYPAPSFGYQWERCNASGGGCVAIVGASEPTYTAEAADVGSTLVVVVKGTNGSGSASTQSLPTAVVTGAPAGGGGLGDSGIGGGILGGEVPPGTAQIQAALLGALVPGGKEARIASVRKHRGYQVTFDAPSRGVVVISWYELPKGAHLASAKPVLVASARATITAKGAVKLTIELTARGRSLLTHRRHLKLTSQGVFTPAGGSPVTVVKSFVLR
jgi:hypothetical protein